MWCCRLPVFFFFIILQFHFFLPISGCCLFDLDVGSWLFMSSAEIWVINGLWYCWSMFCSYKFILMSHLVFKLNVAYFRLFVFLFFLLCNLPCSDFFSFFPWSLLQPIPSLSFFFWVATTREASRLSQIWGLYIYSPSSWRFISRNEYIWGLLKFGMYIKIWQPNVNLWPLIMLLPFLILVWPLHAVAT